MCRKKLISRVFRKMRCIIDGRLTYIRCGVCKPIVDEILKEMGLNPTNKKE